jgi:hypothetical protein
MIIDKNKHLFPALITTNENKIKNGSRHQKAIEYLMYDTL